MLLKLFSLQRKYPKAKNESSDKDDFGIGRKKQLHRRSLGAIVTTAVSFVFAAFNAATGIIYSSFFSISTAVYIFVIGIAVLMLFRSSKLRKEKDL